MQSYTVRSEPRGWHRLPLSISIILAAILLTGVPALAAGESSHYDEKLDKHPASPATGVTFSPLQVGNALPAVTAPSAPTSVLLGEPVDFTFEFWNASVDPTDVGYGPFVDVLFGPGLNCNTATATFLGQPLVKAGTVTNGQRHPLQYDTAQAPNNPAGVVMTLPAGSCVAVFVLPFGSFVPAQPPAEIEVSAPMQVPPAEVGTPIDIAVRGGFQFGSLTALNDWCCGIDPPVVSAPADDTSVWPTTPVTPRLMDVTKTVDAPPVTGPNWHGTYTLAVDIAQSQTITDVTLTDTLPDNVQYVGYTINNGTGTCATTPSPLTDPGGEIACTFASANGGTDIEVEIEFYVPLEDNDGAPPLNVLDPNTGDDVDIDNTYTMDAMWDPDGGGVLPSEPVGGTCEPPCADGSFTAKSIAVQKDGGLYWNDPVTDPGLTPEDVVRYTLSFEVSDYFAFDDIVLTDLLGDGIEFIIDDPATGGTDTLLAPTLTVTEGGSTILNDVTFDPANYTAPPGSVDGNGDATIQFRVSDQMVTSGEDANLLGGCVDGTNAPTQSCDGNSAPATGVVTFYGLVLENYRNDPGDISVDHADVIPNDVTILGNVLDNVGLAETGDDEDDASSASVTITQGELTKTVWQINGSPVGSNPTASPGDEVTFRLEYTLPSTDTENLAFEDWIPLPMFSVADPEADGGPDTVWSFTASICGVPAPGFACFGPTDTYSGVGAPGIPTLTQDNNGNSLYFDYGTFDGGDTTARKVDLVFTLVVTDDPFTDLLQITNQARSYESNTQGTPANQDKLSPLQIGEPDMRTEKAVVALYDATVHVPPPGPVLGNWRTPDDDPTNQRWISGPLTWGGGLPNDNATETEPYDVLTYAIFMSNQGHSDKGAFDIQIRDSLDTASFQFPSGGMFPEGLNLQVRYGDGTVIPHFTGDPLVDPIPVTSWYGLGGGPDATDNTIDDIFGNGIEILDPDPQIIGACEAEVANPGRSLVVITYDLEILPGVGAGSTLTNTSELFNYSNTEGGVDFTDEFGGEDAGITSQASATIRIDTSKTGDPAGPLTVGDYYIQTIKASISGQTFANERTGFSVSGPPDPNPVVEADGTVGTAIPNGIRLRDRILANGALPILDQATFATEPTCPAAVQTWTVRTAANPTGEVRVFGIDNRQSDGSPGGDEYHVYWVFPAIDNNQDPECMLTVTIPVYIVDEDPGIPAGRFFLPPATNFNVEDRARLEYVVGNTSLNTVEKTYTTTVQQPQMSATKTLLAVYIGPGPIPNTQDLATGLRDTDGAPFTDIRRSDVVRWAIGMENVGHSTAYEVTLTDTLPLFVQYVAGSAFVDNGAGGGVANDGIQNGTEALITPAITGDASTTGQTLNFTLPNSIAEAEVLTVVFQSQVMNEMPLGPIFELVKDNYADIDWSTMSGNQSGERLYDDRYDVGGPYYDTNAGDGNQDDDTASFTSLGLTIDKGFNPSAVPNAVPDNTSTLTFTLLNPNLIPLTGVAFTDELPEGLTYVGAPTITGPQCSGGTATVDLETSTMLTVSDLTINPNGGVATPGECYIEVVVTGTIVGIYDNETSPVTSNETGPGDTAQADLVISKDLGMHKEIRPSPLQAGEVATTTFTLVNGTDYPMIEIEFFEFLPLGSPDGFVEVANNPNATNNGCGGVWDPQPNSVDLVFTGGSLPARTSCTLTVDIQASPNATYVNRVDPGFNSLLTVNTIAELNALVGGDTTEDRLAALGTVLNRGDVVFSGVYGTGAPSEGERVPLSEITGSNEAVLVVRRERTPQGEVFVESVEEEFPTTLPSTGGVMAALLGLPLLLVVLVGGSAVLLMLARRHRHRV